MEERNRKERKRKRKKKDLSVGHSQGEVKGSTWFLKSQKSPAQDSTQLMPRQKGILLMVKDGQLLSEVLWWLFCEELGKD